MFFFPKQWVWVVETLPLSGIQPNFWGSGIKVGTS